MNIVAFDIGGTDIKYGIIEKASEKLIYKNKMATEIAKGRERFIDKLVQKVEELKKDYDVTGVAISCAGSINYETGVIVAAPESIPEFQDINFKEIMMVNFGLPCTAENDVNCFGIAEGAIGNAIGLKNYLTMTIGTGIGGAIFIDGKIHRGSEYNAGEWGRMLIGQTKYESQASITALINIAKEQGLTDAKDGLSIFNAYDAGDSLAERVVGQFYENVARGIANLIYIFNPEKIIIGGGISTRKTIIKEIKDKLEKLMVPNFYKTARIEVAKLGNDSGMYGAYFNFKNQYLK